MNNDKAVEDLIHAVNCHDKQLGEHEKRLDEHDKRLERGNVDFAVISTKLNIIMAVLGAIGVAVCGVIVGGLI